MSLEQSKRDQEYRMLQLQIEERRRGKENEIWKIELETNETVYLERMKLEQNRIERSVSSLSKLRNTDPTMLVPTFRESSTAQFFDKIKKNAARNKRPKKLWSQIPQLILSIGQAFESRS